VAGFLVVVQFGLVSVYKEREECLQMMRLDIYFPYNISLSLSPSLSQLSGPIHSTIACKSSAIASYLPFNRQTTALSSISGTYFLIAAHFTQPIFIDSKRRYRILGPVKSFRFTGA